MPMLVGCMATVCPLLCSAMVPSGACMVVSVLAPLCVICPGAACIVVRVVWPCCVSDIDPGTIQSSRNGSYSPFHVVRLGLANLSKDC